MNWKAFLALAAALVTGLAQAESLEEMYPAPWIAKSNPRINQALDDEGIEGCAKYRYRVASKSESEFLIYCYSGGKPRSAYMVWPNIHKVLGPYTPDTSLL